MEMCAQWVDTEGGSDGKRKRVSAFFSHGAFLLYAKATT